MDYLLDAERAEGHEGYEELYGPKLVAYVHPDINLKRPSTSYMRFSTSKRSEVKGMVERGEVEGTVTMVLGNMWKNMNDEERAPYYNEYIQESNAYTAKLAELGIPPNARIVTKTLPNGQLVSVEEDLEAQLDALTSAVVPTSTKKTSASAIASASLELPPNRVKALGALLPHLHTLNTETCSVVARAGECFAQWLTQLCVVSAQNRGKRTLAFEDVARTTKAMESTQFLRPFIHAVNPNRDPNSNMPLVDFDQTPIEAEERAYFQGAGIPPGIHTVTWEGDRVTGSVPYINKDGNFNVEPIVTKKETAKVGKKKKEEKAANKKLESMARAKDSEIANEYGMQDNALENCTEE